MMETFGLVDTLCPQRPTLNPLDAGRRVGGEALIRRVVRRVTDAERLDHVAVAISTPLVDELGQWIPSDVTVIGCDSLDPIDRLQTAAAVLDGRAMVRVELHSPFVDPQLIDGLVAEAARQPQCDYIGYRTSRRSAATTQLGLFGEWCRRSSLPRWANLHRPADDDRTDLGSLCLLSPTSLQLRFIPVPDGLNRDDLRLRLNDEEDWAAAEEIIEALDPEELSWHGIARLLESTPALRAEMRQRNLAETALPFARH